MGGDRSDRVYLGLVGSIGSWLLVCEPASEWWRFHERSRPARRIVEPEKPLTNI